VSGRKSYEVTDLLSRGAEIRNEIQQKEFTSIANFEKRIAESLSGIKETKVSIDSYDFEIDQEAKDEFPNEVQQCQGRIADLFREIEALDSSLDGQEFVRKAKTTRDEMQKADRTADELRRKVIGNPHYCDREYNEAQKLVKVYDAGKRDIRSARTSLEKFANRVTQDHTRIVSIRSELNHLNDTLVNLNKRAKGIIKIRSQAKLVKQQIQEEFKRLPKDRADKFAVEEYQNLKNNITLFESLDDANVTQSYNTIFTLITEVSQIIEQRYVAFETKRKNVELHMEAVNMKIKQFQFTDPGERALNNSVSIGLFQYEEKFGQHQTRPDYERLGKQAIELFESENFDALEEVLQQMDNLINESTDRCQQLNEYQLKQTFMTQDIVIALDNLGYPQIDVDYIDDDFRNGFTIRAAVGDEILLFERLTVDENGPVVQINHIESVSGTCGPSMEKVMRAMQEQGIFVTDVTKNGQSVIYRERKPEAAVTHKPDKKRGTHS
jgi:hypothetical protein